ncbi:PIN domain nuclease [Streptomyces lavendulae]|uniref:PIN domain nuclease n=1 Tax=Streptomyces lavendulae TaxID=1914 RepID=UPI0024A29054|nr:PIN domain nuclease [Streptomyces lavendulae]GLX18751.1 ribonuclease VapC21 [Streptomyces lavendulae subsp. lavendulae]GLX29326.1 ribonuclease VapC21 [Streptomyces lavendulae subsp. lavendulae]
MSTRFLIDKSALARFPKPAVRKVVEPLHVQGLLALCGAIELEVLYSARGAAEAREIREELRGFDWLATYGEAWDRAMEVQALLIEAGTWKAVSVPDLVVAATAEMHGATVLHYDGDYDMIASVTGQPMQWVVPRGTAG